MCIRHSINIGNTLYVSVKILLFKMLKYITFFLVILSWIVDSALISHMISGRAIINEEDVETKPEKVPACIIDENVCLKSCQKYFTYDAWACVEQLVGYIEKHPVYYCGRCNKQIDDTTENSVQCGSCLVWCHLKCVKKVSKTRHWFCNSCYK